MFEVMVEGTFSAAHALRGYNGKCEKLHGHTFRVQVFIEGEKVNKLGMVIDFEKVKELLRKFLEEFDHQNLNELPYFKKDNPTAENIARVIFEKLQKKIIREEIPVPTKVAVWESPTAYAAYRV